MCWRGEVANMTNIGKLFVSRCEVDMMTQNIANHRYGEFSPPSRNIANLHFVLSATSLSQTSCHCVGDFAPLTRNIANLCVIMLATSPCQHETLQIFGLSCQRLRPANTKTRNGRNQWTKYCALFTASVTKFSPGQSVIHITCMVMEYNITVYILTFNFLHPSKHVHIGPVSTACRNIAVGIPTSDRRRSNVNNYSDIGPISPACSKIAVGIPTSDLYQNDIRQFACCFHSRIYYTHTGYIRGIGIWRPKHIKICS